MPVCQLSFRPIPVYVQAQQKHWRQHTLFCTVHILILKKQVHLSELLIGFSSGFNTIQPHLMASKLLKFNVNPRLILWIVNFLVSCSQTVRHQATLLSSCSVSTSSLQGTVLSPIFFIRYTNDCTGTDTTPVIKSSDDSAMEDLSNSDSVYFAEVQRFSNWCRDNSLDLNVKKIKEMLIDFWKAATVIPDSLLMVWKLKEWPSTNI